MRRDYPDRPIVGVAAVIFEGGRVLLVRRGRPPGYGEWSLPGGVVELAERVTEAVVREVAEEVGLKVEVVELVAVLERILKDAADEVQFHYLLLDFLCRRVAGRLQASSDALSCSYAPLEALGRYGLSQEIRKVIHLAYRRLNGETPAVYLSGTAPQATTALP